jgi:hypothetical protein
MIEIIANIIGVLVFLLFLLGIVVVIPSLIAAIINILFP